MVTSAVIWRSECEDIYGMVVFDEDVYDFNYAMQKLINSGAILAHGDRIDLVYFEDDDDEDLELIVDYLNETSENDVRVIDTKKVQIAVAVSHKFGLIEVK